MFGNCIRIRYPRNKTNEREGEVVLHEECIIGQNCGPLFGQVRIAVPVIGRIEDTLTRRIKNIIQGRGNKKHGFGKRNR